MSRTLLLTLATALITMGSPVAAQASSPTVSSTDTMTAAALPVVDPEIAFQRAATWLTADNGGPVPYSMSRCFPGFTAAPCTVPQYRTDCSGFVSMAFGLSRSYVTAEMDNSTFATRISKQDLRPGDLMLNGNPPSGSFGHVVLFEKWADSAHTKYLGYEQSGSGGTRHHVIPYPYFASYTPSLFPYRYNNIKQDPEAPPLPPRVYLSNGVSGGSQ
jgi:hypothetical protein